MGGASLPPGFRFHPTDEELVGYYLKRKVQGLEIELEVIPEIDLYKYDPWELPDKSFLPKRDMEWFFFCPRDKKYPNGSRTNRATKVGYWKATGKDRKVVCQSGGVTGYRKTLVFYRGRAPLGDRTDWVMHEYRLSDELSQGPPSFKGAFALCRIIKRNENTQKTSDCLGKPRSKRVGNSSKNGDFNSTIISNEHFSVPSDISCPASDQYYESRYSSPSTSHDVTPAAELEPVPEIDPANFWVSPDLILDSSKDYPQLQEAMPNYFTQYGFSILTTPWQSYEHKEVSPSSLYSNFPGELEFADDLSRFGRMLPYSGFCSQMGFCGTDHMQYEGTQVEIRHLGNLTVSGHKKTVRLLSYRSLEMGGMQRGSRRGPRQRILTLVLGS